MNLRYLHIYRDSSNPSLKIRTTVHKIRTLFPALQIDLRESFARHWNIGAFRFLAEESRIIDTKQPFERQPKQQASGNLYDGFELQKSLRDFISDRERGIDHIHVVLSDLLTCTFDEDDWRYHARPVVCGVPSIVSLSGIVEGPAKPKEYYYLARVPLPRHPSIEKQFAGRFIDYDDKRMSTAVFLYVTQAIFYFVTRADPFCDNKNCMIFNSHWQEDLIRIIKKQGFCREHRATLNNFNKTAR